MSECNVLLVYPRFNAGSFWNYGATCEMVGAKYPAPPLGLITVAAMLPENWNVRLIDRNTGALTNDDLAWADMVMTGGMLPQQADCLAVIRRSQEKNVPVVVGGPDATSSPEVYEAADFLVLGEAEGILTTFVDAWKEGVRNGRFSAEKFKADVSSSPVPRFDLLRFDDYVQIGVQYSRGCPFTCEFCDIIELYGRVPRTKTNDQMLAELDRLYELGYRGHVDFVDDNLIGNKKAVMAFLPLLIDWQRRNGYPFSFSTEASLNLADDPKFLGLLRDAYCRHVGVEYTHILEPEQQKWLEERIEVFRRQDGGGEHGAHGHGAHHGAHHHNHHGLQFTHNHVVSALQLLVRLSSALRAALREDPDIVLVGEMRDLETISIAIETAETGHLVFSPLRVELAELGFLRESRDSAELFGGSKDRARNQPLEFLVALDDRGKLVEILAHGIDRLRCARKFVERGGITFGDTGNSLGFFSHGRVCPSSKLKTLHLDSMSVCKLLKLLIIQKILQS